MPWFHNNNNNYGSH